MTAHLTSAAVVVALGLSFSAPQASQARGQGSAAAKPGTVVVSVVDESGSTITGAVVALRGSVERQGLTGSTGVATLQNVPGGTHRIRISRDGFVMLEKEVVVKAGARATADAVLSNAPAPPPPPPAPKPDPKPMSTPTPAGPVGQPRTLDLSTLADQMLREKDQLVERDLGCSVATSSKLILVRENLPSHSHSDADEVFYLLAGEATIRVFDKETQMSPGSYSLVPRGTAHSITKRGRGAVILLSVRSGPPCA